MAKLSFYFDDMMSRPVAEQLIRRGYKVVMAIDVGMTGKDDSEHLAYATEQNLALITFDRPFAGRTMQRTDHSGLICLSGGQQNDVGTSVNLLVDFGEHHSDEEVVGQVFWL